MHKKIITLLFVLSMLMMAGCSKDKSKDETEGKENIETDSADEEGQVFSGGLEDNIFDDDVTIVDGSQTGSDVLSDANADGTDIGNQQGNTDSQAGSQTNNSGNQNGNAGGQTNNSGNQNGNAGSQTNNSGNQNGSTGSQTNNNGNQNGSTGSQTNNNGNQNSNAGGQQGGSNNNNNNNNGNVQNQPSKDSMDYETFSNMAPSDQQAYMESFDSIEKFFEWYNAAKDKYEKDHPSIEIGGNGTIDLDKITNGK